MQVGLEEYRHEAGECYARQVATLQGPCGDPRCVLAHQGRATTTLVTLSSQWAPLRPTTVYTAGLSPRTRSDIAYRLETGDRVAMDTTQENIRHPEHEYAQLEAIRRIAIKRRARVALGRAAG